MAGKTAEPGGSDGAITLGTHVLNGCFLGAGLLLLGVPFVDLPAAVTSNVVLVGVLVLAGSTLLAIGIARVVGTGVMMSQ